ncbi:MAG TPA: energy transducer TonB [Candidatus Angelobacter sp.]|jgi:TonB family protein|nr:energy transducer TonB [Candidatus Angelobacter sp.]
MLKQANRWESPNKPMLVAAGGSSSGATPRPVYVPIYVPTFRHEVIAPSRFNRMAESIVFHIFFILLLITVGKLVPKPTVQPLITTKATPLIAPYAPRAVPKITAPPPKVLARLTPPTPPKLVAPEPPKVEPPKVEPKPEPKPVEVAKAPEPPVPVPAPKKKEVVTDTFAPAAEVIKPVEPKKKEVLTNTFASGSSEPATVHKPSREVQTGGFGDPNGLPGVSDHKAKLTVASVGSFDLPSGAGQGNGTGGTHGVRGTIASAGFGDGVAGPGSGDHGRRGTVTQGGFGEVTSGGSGSGPRVRAEAKPAETPVEIQFKPRPTYTDEARKLGVEGEVLLEVLFGAAGDIRVQRVVRGLGHGLDESAQRAAQQVRFTPAKRDGRPYDSVAMVHIVFQLAQ